MINLFTSFGYFEDPEEDRQVALNMHHSLKAGGSFLIEMMGKEVLAGSIPYLYRRAVEEVLASLYPFIGAAKFPPAH